MKIPEQYAMGTIRFSTGKYTDQEEIDKAVESIAKSVKRLNKSGDRRIELIEDESKVKLTHYTHGLGCACKIRPQYLEKVLKDLALPIDPNVLVSLSSSDDAAVYRIDEKTAIIQSVDFFTPVVDNPYHFGAIAAANALSDIYAMGGKPIFALNIVGFPDNRLPIGILKNILKGAQDKAQEAGINILGGHTVEDTEPKFGMAVTGIIDPGKIITNSNAQTGDVLVLTKPLGTGIISTAVKRGLANKESEIEAIQFMSELNQKAALVMQEFPVNACTDITGFGLLGHLKEMTIASKVDVELFHRNIPVIRGAMELAANNIIPGGTQNNLDFVSDIVQWGDGISNALKYLLSDAQTSGGLLFSLPERFKNDFMEALRNKGINHSCQIGKVVNNGVGKILISDKE